MNSFLLLLLLEVIAGLSAGVLFSNLERPLAGLIAGSIFCLVGLAAVWLFYKKAARWRYLSLLITLIYLIGFALPLLVTRLSLPFNQEVTEVLGVSMDIFHRSSEIMFMLLVVFTIAQWMLSRKQPKE